MVTPRALILMGPGTNCEEETAFACRRVGFQAEVIPARRLFDRPGLLDRADLFVAPGGFSYGDDLGAGTVLGLELRRLREPFRYLVDSGRLILGICNGFQVLTKAGFLPDPSETRPSVTLAPNDSGRYEDRWVRLKVASTLSPFLRREEILELPVAHAEGKFSTRGEGRLEELRRGGQVVLEYVDPRGGPAKFPDNPNGSEGGVAGICDPTGRILGLMPHPERFQEITQHPEWTRRRIEEPQGLRFFSNAREHLRGG